MTDDIEEVTDAENTHAEKYGEFEQVNGAVPNALYEKIDKQDAKILELKEKLDFVRGEYESVKFDNIQLRLYRDNNEVWMWQPDGGNGLKSLGCPILIMPRDLIYSNAAIWNEAADYLEAKCQDQNRGGCIKKLRQKANEIAG